MLKTVARRRIVDGLAARARHANLTPLTTKTTQEAILFRVTRVEEGEVIGVHTGFVLSLLAGGGRASWKAFFETRSLINLPMAIHRVFLRRVVA
jgi:hypothetical protein